jgi:hypothetical protein
VFRISLYRFDQIGDEVEPLFALYLYLAEIILNFQSLADKAVVQQYDPKYYQHHDSDNDTDE